MKIPRFGWHIFLFLAFAVALHAQSPQPSASPASSPPLKPDDPAIYMPSEARFYAEKGNAAFANGNLEAAKTNYEKVAEIAPDNILGMVNLGTVYYRMQKYPEAEGVLQKAVSRNFRTPAAWTTLGLMYLEKERLDEALGAFSMAAAHDPRNARVHNYLGVTVGRKGWVDAAEAELRKALEIDGKYAEANFNLAVFYMERNPPAVELARRHYQRAVELGAEPDPIMEKKLEKK